MKKLFTIHFVCFSLVALAGWSVTIIAAQPKNAGVQIHVSPRGDDSQPGSSAKPLATLPAALNRLMQLRKTSAKKDVTIVLHDGVHRIAEPLVIEPTHMNGGRLTFIAAKGAKPIISGGRPIQNWQAKNDGTLSSRLADVAAGKWMFRELFVNGKRRHRARHPNRGYLRAVKASADRRTGLYFNPGDLPKGIGKGAELVFLHDWSITRVPVKSVNLQKNLLTVTHNIGCKADHYRIDHFEKNPRYYVENDPALLDQPGEWHVNSKTGVLTYHPMPNETVDNIEAVAPFAKALLHMRGDGKNPVRNVHFRGITFAHAGWQLPPGGYASGQATIHEWRDFSKRHSTRRMMDAAVTFTNAEDCSVTHCRIAHLGLTGLEFGSRTKRCRVENNVFEDISGNSLNLGEDTSRRVNGKAWWQAAPKQAASHHVVANNLIENGGQQFFGSVAVWVGIARHMHIHHNEIRNHPYTGISLGWMWNPTPTPAGHHTVEHNHIHHIMQKLSDGGGIYTLGRQPGTIFRANHIHDIPLNAGRAESNGMFLDQGSDQITIAGNVIYNVTRAPLRFHQAKSILVKDNVLVVPNAKTPAYRYNRTDAKTIERENNRVVELKSFDVKSATAIIKAAGLIKR